MATYWGIDLAASKVAVACVGDRQEVKFVAGQAVKREDHGGRILRACWLSGCVGTLLRGVGPDDLIAIESPSCAQQGSGHSTGEVFGLVLRLVESEASGRWFFAHPSHLKQFAAGSGKADKAQIGAACQRWGFQPGNEDEADAYVLARMAECVRHPERFTLGQVEAVSRSFRNKGGAKNLQFTHPAECPPGEEPAAKAHRKGKGGQLVAEV
jgi:Holliday junction resolvasome RuvABC endonuclease subunit